VIAWNTSETRTSPEAAMIGDLRLEEIGHAHLLDLVDASYAEGQRIDYKLELPDFDGVKREDAKKKFLADIAAFANAGGGDILYGVEEGRDDGKPNGKPVDLAGSKA
jgi:hypothetical protein